MKFILVVSFVFSLLLSSETRLIIGCFKEPRNAQNAKVRIDEFVQNDVEFQNFLNKNSVITKYTKIGDWNVISFEPFSNSTTLYHTYFKIKNLHPDAYKVAIGEEGDKEILALYSKPKDDIKEPSPVKSEMKEEEPAQEMKIPTYQSEMEQSSSNEDKAAAEQAKKKEAPEITRDTLKKEEMAKDASNAEFPYLYPLIAIILIVVILIIYFTQKKPKKQLQTLKEEIHEELS